MELPEGLSPLRVAMYFLVASVLLYSGIAMGTVLPGGYHESQFEKTVPLLFFILPALLLTCRIAWLLRQPASNQSRGCSFRLTLPLSLGVVLLGAALISLVIFRQDWIEIFWGGLVSQINALVGR
jgi:predicted small integral membrane protein